MSELNQVTGILEIVGRTSAVYFFILFGLRVAGKREMGQMTVFDLVVILVIANAVQNAMVGSNTSLLGGLVAAATLLTINFFVSKLRYHHPLIAHWIGGMPTVIIQDGRFVPQALKKEALSEDEVLMAIREHGFDSPDQVKVALLETDGSISVVPKDGRHIRHRRRVRVLKKGS
ncbi:MAG TPA: YetF domain-containing protein [Pantanalinema sp.]